jgi:hypothetical protein
MMVKIAGLLITRGEVKFRYIKLTIR